MSNYVKKEENARKEKKEHNKKENGSVTKETIAVAERLPKLMEERGYTQKELAAQIGISDSMLNSIINKTRNVSSDVLVKLALTLDVTTDHLLGLTVQSAEELTELKQRKESMENEIAELLKKAADASAKGRSELLKRVTQLDKEVAELDAMIKRSEVKQPEPPFVREETAAYGTAPRVEADSAVVIDESNSSNERLPKGAVLYLKSAARVQREKLYAIKRDGKIMISEAPDEERDEILGEVTHVLVPTQAYKRAFMHS